MTERYALLIARSRGQTLPPGWRTAMERRGLRYWGQLGRVSVFAEASTAVTIAADKAVVIGSLFSANHDHAIRASEITALPPGTDLSRWVVDQNWGRYVIVSLEEGGRVIDLVRDPGALVPCCMVDQGEWVVAASDARLISDLCLVGVQIDWTAVAGFLAFRDLRPHGTCLEGFSEPFPAERVRIAERGLYREHLWSPAPFCVPSKPTSYDATIEQLRETVDRCVAAWTAGKGTALLSLSGGLDSSIVASSVPNARNVLHGITLVSGRGLGDEREYAAEVASRAGFPLHFERIDGRGVNVVRSLAADRASPTARAFTQPIDRALATCAASADADVHLDGGGGDAVFGFLHSANPAADRLRREGLGRGFARTLIDLSKITGCTPAHIGRRAITKAWFNRPRFRWPALTTMMAPGVAQDLAVPSHPWMDDLAPLLPGQRAHGLAILQALNTVDHLNIEDDRPTIYPLLSQPLVEFCLGIPSWWNCERGRDRSMARAAFSDRLPAGVAQRRLKGNFNGLADSIVEHHRSRIREMLIEGQLAIQGLIDVEEVRRTLDPIRPVGDNFARLLHFVDAEAWASAWV